MPRHRWKDEPHDLTGAWMQTCSSCCASRELVADEDGSRTIYYNRDGRELGYIPECGEDDDE
jgi:hypothetical protein